nr:MAG TPA: hypothetical protein [Caudoviricetes sp.]
MTEDAEIVVGRTSFWPKRVGHVQYKNYESMVAICIATQK